MHLRRHIFLVLLAAFFFPGCITGPSNPSATQPATAIDPQQASWQYWLDKPATSHATASSFDPLFKACETEVRYRLFLIDRQDFRLGLLTTQPMVSKQFFEIWRSDAVTVPDISDSSLATVRRTVFFQLQHLPNGQFIAEPKVLVERFTSVEHHLTAINEYHSAFSGPRPTGTAEGDLSAAVPTEYWYPVGRDPALERSLAESIQNRVGTPPQ